MRYLTKILTKILPKKLVEVPFPISHRKLLETVPGFKNLWEYYKKGDKIHPAEWGKLEIDHVVIKFIAIPGK